MRVLGQAIGTARFVCQSILIFTCNVQGVLYFSTPFFCYRPTAPDDLLLPTTVLRDSSPVQAKCVYRLRRHFNCYFSMIKVAGKVEVLIGKMSVFD